MWEHVLLAQNSDANEALRKLERRVDWGWFGRPSFGFIAMVGVYIVVNVTLCSTNIVMRRLLNHWASRFGW